MYSLVTICDSFHKITTLNPFAGSSSLEITHFRKLKPCQKQPTQNVNIFIYYGTPKNYSIYNNLFFSFLEIPPSCWKQSNPSPIPHIQTFLLIINTQKPDESDKVSKIICMELYGAQMEIYEIMKANS